MGFVIGAPFASGILATGAVPGARYRYADATPDIMAKVSRIEAVCAQQALFVHWPNLQLAVEPSQIRWRRRPGLRSIEKLPVVAGD